MRDFLARTLSCGDRYHALWVMLATTGMRRGEALGLRWSDLELDAGIAAVVQTVVVVNHRVQLSALKTARGARVVGRPCQPNSAGALKAG